MPPKSTKKTGKKVINLALQGGGAHGAFTWGVLDALLEEETLEFEGITATSAGSMNAAAFISGYVQGGRAGARESLETFWRAVSRAGDVWGGARAKASWNAIESSNPFIKWFGFDDLDESAMFAVGEALNWTFSPYQLNPLGFNPLRGILERTVDCAAIQSCERFKLFICATNVRTGQAKIFRNNEASIDVLLASAALPFLFQAIEIGEEAYWDGGYIGNPSLWPLFYEAQCRDLLLIHVNPVMRNDIPRRAYAIQNRLNEVTFNSSLLKELRAIAFVKKLIEEDMLRPEYQSRYKDILLHAVRSDTVMSALSVASKYNTSWEALTHLFDLGRKQGRAWLRKNLNQVGVSDTVDIQAEYLNL